VNADRRRWGTSVVGVRILVAGLVLLGAGCAVLGWGTRWGKAVPVAATAGYGTESVALTLPGSDLGRESLASAHAVLAGLPLLFEPNQGQGNLNPADPRARFVTHGPHYSVVLGSEGAILSLVSRPRGVKAEPRVQTLQMKLAGSNPDAVLSGTDRLPGKSNYFIGNDPEKWRTGVPQFARVRYVDVYPGINLVFYGSDGHLEYDFQVAPGGDPAQAELEFNGAKQLELKDGSLIARCANGSVRLDAPNVYQEVDGRKQKVEGSFVLRAGNRAGFSIGAYDRSRELIIDPTLNFSTYFGGSGDEHNTYVAVDGSLNIYLTGSTTSPNLPVTAGSSLTGAQNVYVAKIQPPLGSIAAQLLEMTYLGGTGTDYPVGIKVDGGNNPYVAGTTTSEDFPTTATTAYQTAPEAGSTGTSHAFVSKLKSDFSGLAYSSYLSGNGTDIASGMTTDSAGGLYVTGTTTSSDAPSSTVQFPASTIPEKFAFQSIPKAAIQFFVTKVDTTAPRKASIPYSTYFGGGNFATTDPIATGGGIAVDGNLNIYFTGTTNFTYSGCANCSTTDFPILNAYQPCLDSSPQTTISNPQTCDNAASVMASDAFLAKLNPNAAQGQQLIWSTYLGGGETDSSTGVALDSGATNVYVVGTTNSTDFVSLSVKSYASYQACLNNVTLTPPSGSVASCAGQATTPAPSDAFVARLSNPASTTSTTNVALTYFSYLGGRDEEAGSAITVDSNSGAMITGLTQSPFTGATTAGTFPVFPFPSSIQSNLNGTQDAFVARLNSAAVIGQTTTSSWASYFGGSGVDAGTSIALDVNQNSYLAGETTSTDLQVVKPLSTNTNNAGGVDSFATQFGTAVSLSISGVLSLGTGQQYISAGNPATFTYTVTNNGPDPASGIVIAANLGSQFTGVTFTNMGASISSGTCGGGGSSNTSLSCGPISLQSGATATVTITATPSPNSSGTSPVFFNGGNVQAIGPGNVVLAETSVSAQMSDFSMSVSPGNQSVPFAGATATYQVQLIPHPLYTSGISISCGNLPAASKCIPSTSPVTLANQSGAAVTLSITTTARPITTTSNTSFGRPFYALWWMIPGMAVLGIGGSRRRRKLLGIVMLCTLCALTILIPACSSGTKTQTPGAGTQAGKYTITVTAAAQGDSKTQPIVLTVP